MKRVSYFGVVVTAFIAFAASCVHGQPSGEVRQTLTFQIGDGTLILSYGTPMINIVGTSSYPHSFSFITPPPSMEYIMLPTRPLYKPPIGYTFPPAGYYPWQYPVVILYPSWYWGYPTHWWDYKPALWLMLTRPPVILIFKLNKAKADDVAQRLRESRVHPMLRFMSFGDKLIVSGPQEVLTGVGQARIRKLIKELDETPQLSQGIEGKERNLNAAKRKMIVETYAATSDVAQPDGSLPQDIMQAANTLGLSSVRMLRTDECEITVGQATVLNWEAARSSTMNDFRIRGSLRICPIAIDDSSALVNLSLSASVGLPSKSLWARHATNTNIICDGDKPALVISNDAATRSSLILRIRQTM